MAEAADGPAPDSGSQDHSCVVHTHRGQGRSRVKRTPWPRGIQRPPEDRGLAPRAKTEGKNCSRDTCSTLDKETSKAKGDLSFPAEISFQARGLDGWRSGVPELGCHKKPNDSVPRKEQGHHAAPVRDGECRPPVGNAYQGPHCLQLMRGPRHSHGLSGQPHHDLPGDPFLPLPPHGNIFCNLP